MRGRYQRKREARKARAVLEGLERLDPNSRHHVLINSQNAAEEFQLEDFRLITGSDGKFEFKFSAGKIPPGDYDLIERSPEGSGAQPIFLARVSVRITNAP